MGIKVGLINRIKTFSVLAKIITFYELAGILLFISVFFLYENPDYLIQAYGVMVLVFVIFLVPNRWIYKIIVSALIILVFNIISVYTIDDLHISQVSAVIVYSIIILILSSINSFRDNYYQRIQFITNRELRSLSITDSLTGIYNKSKFNEEYKNNYELYKRYKTPLSLIIIDFDDFKKVNDTYGHILGDNILVEFVNIVKNNIREIDVFARWGGEEFVILLPNTDIKNVLVLAERLRFLIEKCKFIEVGEVTCSFGVAEINCDDSMESLLKRADEMLYLAKMSGKNRVIGDV